MMLLKELIAFSGLLKISGVIVRAGCFAVLSVGAPNYGVQFFIDHSCCVCIALSDWSCNSGRPRTMRGETYMWRGEWNYVRLDPPSRVAHVIALAFES